MRSDRVRKEIRHFSGRHGRIDVREIREHLPSPVVEEIEGHQVPYL